jgi:anti-sigma factor RsiW
MSRFDAEHPDVDDILGAYALDAVDPAERALVEQRLADDPVARAEVDEMRETAAALASLPTDDEGAPAGLWGRIADAIGSPDAVTGPASDAAAPRAVAPRTAAPEPAALPANVVPFTRPTRSFSARIVVPIAAAAALVIAVLGVQIATRSPNHAGDLAAAYNHAVDGGAATVPLRAGTPTGGVTAEVALQSDGTGYLRNDRLPELPEGKTYQLWALVAGGTGQQAISAGVLGRNPTATAFHVSGAPSGFAITVENAPGVITSKQSPVAVGEVPA